MELYSIALRGGQGRVDARKMGNSTKSTGIKLSNLNSGLW